jgi:hypothetical protein
MRSPSGCSVCPGSRDRTKKFRSAKRGADCRCVWRWLNPHVASNLWQGPANDLGWVAVYAGGVPVPSDSLGSNAMTPAVFVYTASPDPKSARPLLIFGPVLPSDTSVSELRGKFTVKSVSAGVLTLSLEGSSRTFQFDTRTLLFR